MWSQRGVNKIALQAKAETDGYSHGWVFQSEQCSQSRAKPFSEAARVGSGGPSDAQWMCPLTLTILTTGGEWGGDPPRAGEQGVESVTHRYVLSQDVTWQRPAGRLTPSPVTCLTILLR